MKKVFTHDNMITFGFVLAAVTIGVLYVIPIVRKFVPASLLPARPATTTTAAAGS